MSLDGFAILKYVAAHAEQFADARDSVDEAALNILAGQFQAGTFDLGQLKRLCKALGGETLSLVFEHVPDEVPQSLIGRIDPHHPKADAGDAAWARSHVVALGSGKAKPEPKPKAAAKKAGAAKSKKKSKPEDDFVIENFWASSVMAKPARLSKPRGKPK
jgi:hypothetical protein